jgi:hypothetical protein
MHLDEEQVQRLLHGELGGVAEASARAHLESCSECRSRLAQAEQDERWVLERLRQLDHSPPPMSAKAIASRSPRRTREWGRLAAGILFALAVAGVAYAMPGSPLPRVLDRVIEWATNAVPQPRQGIRLPRVSGPPRGIAIAPGNRLVIEFTREPGNGIARVTLTDGSEVVVHADTGGATFTSDVDRLSIEQRGDSADFEIVIPRAAPLVEIRVGSRQVFLKEASRVTADGERDAQGRYLVPLSGSEP